MIGIIKDEYEDTVAIKIEGELTADDYDNVLPMIERRMKQDETVNFYCEVKNVKNIEPEAIWKDLKFDVKHFDDFDRIAVVGDKEWTDWLTQLSKPFTTGEVKHFHPSDKDIAWEWVRSQNDN